MRPHPMRITEWFTGLLREKTEELERERLPADCLAGALRAWYAARAVRRPANSSTSEAELRLINPFVT
jgi:hypothetical protein